MSLIDLFKQLGALIGLPVVILASIGAALVVIARDWRLALSGFMLMNVMLALLLSQLMLPQWALQQVVAGGLVAVILYLSARQLQGVYPRRSAESWPILPSLSTFRLLAVGLAVVGFNALRTHITLPELSSLQRDALVWLVAMGLLGLALHEEPFHAGLSLLTVLGGAEILLFGLTQRRMLVGILLPGQVLLGLAIAYLTVAHGLPREAAAEGTEGSP